MKSLLGLTATLMLAAAQPASAPLPPSSAAPPSESTCDQPVIMVVAGPTHDRARMMAYAKAIATPSASDGLKAIAWLNTGTASEYGLKDATKARAAYAEAVKLNPELKTTVDGHLATLQ